MSKSDNVPWCAFCYVAQDSAFAAEYPVCNGPGNVHLAHRWVLDATPERLAAGELLAACRGVLAANPTAATRGYSEAFAIIAAAVASAERGQGA